MSAALCIQHHHLGPPGTKQAKRARAIPPASCRKLAPFRVATPRAHLDQVIVLSPGFRYSALSGGRRRQSLPPSRVLHGRCGVRTFRDGARFDEAQVVGVVKDDPRQVGVLRSRRGGPDVGHCWPPLNAAGAAGNEAQRMGGVRRRDRQDRVVTAASGSANLRLEDPGRPRAGWRAARLPKERRCPDTGDFRLHRPGLSAIAFGRHRRGGRHHAHEDEGPPLIPPSASSGRRGTGWHRPGRAGPTVWASDPGSAGRDWRHAATLAQSRREETPSGWRPSSGLSRPSCVRPRHHRLRSRPERGHRSPPSTPEDHRHDGPPPAANRNCARRPAG